MANLFPDNVIKLISSLPPEQAVLIRGPHGIGKSQVAAEVGRLLDLPVIDLRLSQMTEGDFLGLPRIVEPELDAEGNTIKFGMTEFRPPWWFVKAMTEPVVLLLDEVNRAVTEVMQCAFQLILDRMIQGRRIHPGTRIIAAVNASHHYQVNEMDPALLDRFLTVDMVPSIKVWKIWAQKAGIDSAIVEFCTQHTDHWWHNPGTSNLEPNKIYPTPRSWEMVNRDLAHMGLFNSPSDQLFRFVAQGLVGDEAGSAFFDFVKNYDRNISAEQLLNQYDTIKERVKSGLTIDQVMTIVEKLANHSKTTKWKQGQVQNIANFMADLANGEQVFAMWNKLNGLSKDSELGKVNALLVHRFCKEHILAAVGHGGGGRTAAAAT